MHPFLYETTTSNGLLRIPTYGTFILLSFMAAFALVHNRARRVGIPPERMIPLYGASAVGGLIGAKLLYAIAVDPSALFSGGGFAFYGGLIGGAIAVLATAAVMHLPGWKLVDVLAPAVVLGLGIGRLACFFAGCCHGAVAQMDENALGLFPDGGFLHGQVWLDGRFPYLFLEFHDGVGRLHGEPLYPTQLWSAFAGIGLSAFLTAMWSRRRFDGQLAAMMMVFEPALRIVIESYRADDRGYVVSWAVRSVPSWLPPGFSRAGGDLPTMGDAFHQSAIIVGVTTSQFLALGFIGIGALIFALRWNGGVTPEIPIEGDE